jgi:hypothetical protein
MGLSNWGANQVVDYIMGNSSIPATMYLAVTSGEPIQTDTGSDLNEPVDTGYARVAISTGASWSSGESGTTTLLDAVELGPSVETWGNITHWAICDSLTDGNLLMWGSWDQQMSVYAGQKLVVPSEGIGFSVSSLTGSAL